MAKGPKLSLSNHVYWDSQRGRYQYVREFDLRLQPYIGVAFSKKWPKGVVPTEEQIHDAGTEFYARQEARDVPAVRSDVLLEAWMTLARSYFKDAKVRGAALDAEIAAAERYHAEIELREHAERLGLTLPAFVPEAVQPRVPLSQALIDYKKYHLKEHGGWRSLQAEHKAITAKTTAAESLFASAGTDDMGAITTAMIQQWKDGMDDRPRPQYDALNHIAGLYTALCAANRLGEKPNPMERIHLPARPDQETGRPFSEDDQRRIVADAIKSGDTDLIWGHVLACFMGTIASELVEADASDFKMASELKDARNIDPAEDRLVFDMQDRKLKTAWRPRWIPVHPAVLRLRFRDYLETRKGKKLFDLNAAQFSAKLMAHIRGLGIEGKDQNHRSWRHGFTTQLDDENVSGAAQRILTGHAAPDVHERNYIKKSLAKRVEAIGVLFDPTA